MGDASISSMPETSRKTATPRRSAKTRKWVRKVTTDSTHAPRGTFTSPAAEIARTMARKDVSPGGIGSGIRMIQYFINRGGKNLSATRRAELEKAKRILQRRVARQKATTKKR
jgi:tRNA(adenine34) deaminase